MTADEVQYEASMRKVITASSHGKVGAWKLMITCSTVFSGGFFNVYDKFAGDIADTD